MLALGSGRLKLSPFVCTDGIIHFKVYDPILRRIMKHRKRDLSVVGNWLAIGNKIIWFRKGKD